MAEFLDQRADRDGGESSVEAPYRPLSALLRTTCRLLPAVAVVAFLGACSSVPDAVNPVEWGKSVGDLLSGEDEQTADSADGTTAEQAKADVRAQSGEDAPGGDQAFPNLAGVPTQKPQTTSEAERQAIQDGLVADRNGRRYSDQVIERQGEASNPLRTASSDAPPPPPEVGEAPAPAPAPAKKVVAESFTPPSSPAPAGTAPATVDASTQKVVAQQTAAAMPAGDGAVPLPTRPPEGADVIAFYQAKLEEQRRIQADMAKRTDDLMKTPNLEVRPLQPQAPSDTVDIGGGGVEGGPDFGSQGSGNPYTGGLAPNGAVKVAIIQFTNGSAQLSSQDRRILRDVRQLQAERGGRLRVVGHASSRTGNMDKVQHMMVNYDVSVQRAEAISRELIRLGVKSEDISVAAVSDSDPVYHEVMPSGEAGNRRAEIYLEN
ncbi:MAG: OmpA family protein [Rhodospirillales bacterium]